MYLAQILLQREEGLAQAVSGMGLVAITPEQVCERAAGGGLIGLQGEKAEKGTILLGADRDDFRAGRVGCFERAQKTQLQQGKLSLGPKRRPYNRFFDDPALIFDDPAEAFDAAQALGSRPPL